MESKMALTRELSGEELPRRQGSSEYSIDDEIEKITTEITNCDEQEALSEVDISERVEAVLQERIHSGDKAAVFLLGQLYFERGEFTNAASCFETAAQQGDFQAKFQLGVLLYDGLAGKPEHKRGFDLMLEIAESPDKRAKHLLRAAQYNVGRAYFRGYGVRQSYEEAEKYWLLAADDGSPRGSVKAQCTLGLYYSRDDHRDLKKAFFWHTEACGNGSLESQGAQGVMYLKGYGTKVDTDAAFICLRQASARGNVYAMGHLVAHYYQHKFYNKATSLAARVAMFEGDVQQLANETDCLPAFISKGISMGAFYYARCLQFGLGVKRNTVEARKYYSKSFYADPDTCAVLQGVAQQGTI